MSTQRLKKRARVDSDEEFEDTQSPTQRSSTQARSNGEGSKGGNIDQEEIDRKVKNAVRLAIASEFNKRILKREDFVKIANDNHRIPYNILLEKVREKLNKVFGMDLYELPKTKEKLNQSQTQMTNRNGESSTQAGESSTQAAFRSGTSGTYILRNRLKESYGKPDIITRSSEEYKQIGILYIILSLIFLNGQSMTSPDLFSHLDRLRVMDRKSESESKDKIDRESLLDFYIKNNYLKKTKRPDTSGEDQEYDFTWGPRSKIEFPTTNVVNFMLNFYNVSEEEKKALETKMYKQGGYEIGQ